MRGQRRDRQYGRKAPVPPATSQVASETFADVAKVALDPSCVYKGSLTLDATEVELELFSADFFAALAAIIVIDLVLAGDNAIVIALAARSLPAHLRTKAIVWGTFGAIAVRTVMTLAVVWLLKIPGLLLAGGVLLVWIAYRLLIDNEEDGPQVAASTSLAGAMKTIIVADAVMGLDNVLAVAGAAHGSFLLVVLGLLISIPIVIWGSQIILRFVERYPVIVYVGGGVLAWTAAKMICSEPLVKNHLDASPALTWLVYVAVMGGVLIGGILANYARTRAAVGRHLVDLATVPAVATVEAGSLKGGNTMMKVLVPVNESSNSLQAVRHVLNRFLGNPELEVHLLHVRTPLTQHAARFISRRARATYHRDEAAKALRPARDLLDRFRVPYSVHVELGERAAAIHRVAQRLRVHQIVMGTARKNSLTRMVEDSVTNKVLALTRVPVEIVVGQEISKLERFGVPAGIGAALALLVVAVD